jgi:hypothetical protein
MRAGGVLGVLLAVPVIVAGATGNLPLPPVGPTPPPPQDAVTRDFKAARAAYNAAVQHALANLAQAFSMQRDKVRGGEFPIEPLSETPATLPTPKGINSPFIKRDEKGKTVKPPIFVPGGGKALPKASDFKAPGGFSSREASIEAAQQRAKERMQERLKAKGSDGTPDTKGPPAEFIDPITGKKTTRQEMADRIRELKSDEANASLHEFDKQRKQFGRNDGFIPTHPAMKEAVTEYHRVLDTARAEFVAAIDKILTQSKTAGETDAAKLKPLYAQRGLFQRPELMGVWERKAEGQPMGFRRELWIVDVDAGSGDLQVDCLEIDEYGFSSVAGVRHGENVQFKDGGLSFDLHDVEKSTGAVKKEGSHSTLTPRSGQLDLFCESGVVSNGIVPFAKNGPPVSAKRSEEKTALLSKIDVADGPRKRVALALNRTKIGADPILASRSIDVADVNAVWREIAALSSLAYLRGDHSGPFGGELLYVPYSRDHDSDASAGGALQQAASALRGRRQSNSERITADLLARYDHLAETSDPYLRRAADRAQGLFLSRAQLAIANNQYGNTAKSAMREINATVSAAAKFLFSLDADAEELRRQTNGMAIEPFGTPMSQRTRESLMELSRGSGQGAKDIAEAAIFSGLVEYADMAEVDRQVEFWRTTLLPLAKKCGGPATNKPLAAIEGGWRKSLGNDSYLRLDNYNFHNVSGTNLTHATIEIVAENQWGEKSAQYYYLPELEVGEVALLMPHFRWKKRGLDYSPSVRVTSSVWADQGTNINQHVELKSPDPCHDPDALRKVFLAYDEKYASEGEALGIAIKSQGLIRPTPERQKRMLLDAATPGNSYAFRLPETGKPPKPAMLRYLRVSADKNVIEAEVIGLADKKPLKADTPVWKGKLTADDNRGYVLRLDLGWSFFLGYDEMPVVSLPTGKDADPAQVPLFLLKAR